MADFRELTPFDIKDNPFQLMGKDWMLLTAGTLESWNTMTVAWATLGVTWERNICTVYVRHSRHTYSFMEREPGFTCSFFTEQYRDALEFCGSHSGRTTDKAAETGLTPVAVKGGVAFSEARLVLVCRKLAFHDITPEQFVDPAINSVYAGGDYHRVYVGEIVKTLGKA